MGERTLEERMALIEQKQKAMDDLIELLEQVKGALALFVKIGNGVKWCLGIGTVVMGFIYALKGMR